MVYQAVPTSAKADEESGKPQQKKLRYPLAVFFIIVNEFCERFSFYAMRAVLVLFLKNELKLNEDSSTVVFHAFTMTCYAFPIVGGIVSDSWLGKFRTILYLSLVYTVGSVVLALASWTSLGLPGFPVACVGLLLIAVGTGGIKPCVCSFGGDQFQLPEQQRQLESFFNHFFFVINMGALLGTLITPVLRTQHCLGEDTCFPAAFGLPAVLMVCFCGVFASGRRLYVHREAERSLLVQVSKCVGAHWLDAVAPRFGDALVADVKSVLKTLVVAVPMPVFWALLHMTASRWTFQAVQLDGSLGGGWRLQPDQMLMSASLLVMVLLPASELWLNPLLARLGVMTTPLQRMSVGGLMAAAAFLCAAVLQIYVERAALVADKVHILWQLPQYSFIALADIWLVISVPEFAYKEAPARMKSTVAALFMLTASIGDSIVILVTSSSVFSDRTTEFFVYAGLMTAVMGVFMFLASRYTYVGQHGAAAGTALDERDAATQEHAVEQMLVE